MTAAVSPSSSPFRTQQRSCDQASRVSFQRSGRREPDATRVKGLVTLTSKLFRYPTSIPKIRLILG